ncbi:MAG TPA: cupredoxin family copper-binding protein [Candidatus Elarobacter sp.]|jgi:plastocyanin
MYRLALAFVAVLTLGGGDAALARGGTHLPVAQYADQYPEPPPTPPPATTAAPAPGSTVAPAPAFSPAPSALTVVHIKDFAFVPDTVTIKRGQTVRFIEDDDTPHTVTATDHAFDSGNLGKKDQWSFTFGKDGTYTYICAYHPSMKGTVIVK